MLVRCLLIRIDSSHAHLEGHAHVGALRRPFKSSQPRVWWAGRVVLSIALLFYGVYAQVGSLTRLPTERERIRAAVNPLSKM